MATLNGQQIDTTYPGLLKTNDEAAVTGTLKGLEDGVGTTLPIEISTTGVNFTGTVTGDNNTTYDLASAQNASDVDVTLTGSDATTDTVKLVAGTNITLTDDGSNNVTIDAAGGGGGGETSLYAGTASFKTQGSLASPQLNVRAIRVNAMETDYGIGNQTMTNNTYVMVPFTFAAGETLNSVHFQVAGTSASGSTRVGLYKSAIDANGELVCDTLVSDLGAFSTTSTGLISATGLGITIPSGAVQQTFFFVFNQDQSWNIGATNFNDTTCNPPYLRLDQFGGSVQYRLGYMSATGTYPASMPASGLMEGVSYGFVSDQSRFPMIGVSSI